MSLIKNLLALIGILALLLGGVGYYKWTVLWSEFDAKAPEVYMEMAKKLLETHNGAAATVWKVPVAEDVSVDDVVDSIRLAANDLNFKNVGELPLSDQVAAMQEGSPYRTVRIFMFCNALTAAKMLDYSDAFAAYLPCRVTLIEDKQGALWLYALNMDMMIHGGAPLPVELLKEAKQVREMTLEVMQRGANGDF